MVSHHVSKIDDVVGRERVEEVDHVMPDKPSLFWRHLVRHNVKTFVHLGKMKHFLNRKISWQLFNVRLWQLLRTNHTSDLELISLVNTTSGTMFY
jgi:hypothetical protein